MATATAQTMKAVYQLDPASSTLTRVEIPIPTLSEPDEHIIQIKATAPCLGELGWEVNFPAQFPPERLAPRVPCTECAGVVVSSPPSGNSPFKPGDEVFFRLDAFRPGCLQEYTVARTAEIALKPKSLSWVEAAATPLSSLTAWQGLFEQGILDKEALKGNVEAREKNATLRVLITGAGGSVGSWAVQLAAAAGAGAVIAVSGPSKANDIKKAGATEVVDYTKQSLAEWADQGVSRQCDMALDCIGGSSLTGCWSAVKENGTLLSVADSPEDRKPESLNKKLAVATWFLVEPKGSILAEIADAVDAGKALPWIDSVVEFDDYQKAFDRVESGHAKGKVMIKVAL